MRRGVLLVDRQTFNPIHFSSLDGTGETSKDVLTRWLKMRDFAGSDMVFGVQGWNSQLAFVPTKIEFGDVSITRDGELQVSLMIFPWQGRDAEAARGWRACVQEIGPSTRQKCIILPLNRQIRTLVVSPAPRYLSIPRGLATHRQVRAWVEDADGLPLSRSSRTTRVLTKKGFDDGRKPYKYIGVLMIMRIFIMIYMVFDLSIIQPYICMY